MNNVRICNYVDNDSHEWRVSHVSGGHHALFWDEIMVGFLSLVEVNRLVFSPWNAHYCDPELDGHLAPTAADLDAMLVALDGQPLVLVDKRAMCLPCFQPGIICRINHEEQADD